MALPPDLILYILDFIPLTATPVIALPASHEITKTLLALTVTSRLTHLPALRLLYTRCMFIDSQSRLDTLVRTITTTLDRVHSPRVLDLITSVYLAPFPEHNPGPHTATAIGNLLSTLLEIISRTLKRLVIDMPLRTLFWHPFPKLINTFSQLTSLEIFCSVRDELYLGSLDDSFTWNPDVPIWSSWTQLETLVLYNVDTGRSDFWDGIRKLTRLKHLVLTRADGLYEVDFRREVSAWTSARGKGQEGDIDLLNIVLVNVESQQAPLRNNVKQKEDRFIVRQVNVPTSYYGDEDPIEICQEWVKRRILKGQEVDGWS
ncbi:hypothetical protein F5884DRAFT_767641 [Xylogone sp. PMI_703]|nr:hypothetical protein F5884DRAFT_767641 [Xylogone sp. PMI_703]